VRMISAETGVHRTDCLVQYAQIVGADGRIKNEPKVTIAETGDEIFTLPFGNDRIELGKSLLAPVKVCLLILPEIVVQRFRLFGGIEHVGLLAGYDLTENHTGDDQAM